MTVSVLALRGRPVTAAASRSPEARMTTEVRQLRFGEARRLAEELDQVKALQASLEQQLAIARTTITALERRFERRQAASS